MWEQEILTMLIAAGAVVMLVLGAKSAAAADARPPRRAEEPSAAGIRRPQQQVQRTTADAWPPQQSEQPVPVVRGGDRRSWNDEIPVRPHLVRGRPGRRARSWAAGGTAPDGTASGPTRPRLASR